MIQILLMLVHAILLVIGLSMAINADNNASFLLGMMIVIVNFFGIIINIVGIVQ